MEEQQRIALPVVCEGRLAGLLTRRALEQAAEQARFVGDIDLEHRSVRTGAHLFDLLDTFAQTEADVIPVVENDDLYLGCITLQTVMGRLAMVTEASTPGAIILLEMEPYNYALSDIARITEQNNARVINLFTFPSEETHLLQVMLKVDQEDAANLIRSFERYNYRVVNHYHHTTLTDEQARLRIEELLYYLEM
jgi:Mg/Co/Ni transporter MgtE